MKIAYCSDMHVDFHMRDGQCSKLLFDKAFSKYFEDIDSKTLIIAGDIGHHPEQSMEFMDILRTKYSLDNILVVLGNHEGYLVNDKQRKMFPTGLHKIAYQQDLFQENGITVLDGTSIEIDGITIGGANSFYDGTIYYRMASGYYKLDGGLQAYWKRTMNDSRYMRLDDFWEYAKSEKDKLRLLKNSVDVMVTHINPCTDDVAFSHEYRGDMTNAFYSFDFEEDIMLDSRLQYWIFGHTHTPYSYSLGNVDLVASPRGYPNEVSGKAVSHIEVVLHKHPLVSQ